MILLIYVASSIRIIYMNIIKRYTLLLSIFPPITTSSTRPLVFRVSERGKLSIDRGPCILNLEVCGVSIYSRKPGSRKSSHEAIRRQSGRGDEEDNSEAWKLINFFSWLCIAARLNLIIWGWWDVHHSLRSKKWITQCMLRNKAENTVQQWHPITPRSGEAMKKKKSGDWKN
jgi:hypothetical protein